MPAYPWYNRVNTSVFRDDAKKLILERVNRKLGFTKTIEVLSISKDSLYNYFNGIRRIPDNKVSRPINILRKESSMR